MILVTSYKPILAIWLAGHHRHIFVMPYTQVSEIKQGWGCMFAFLRGPCNFNLSGWKIVKSWWCHVFFVWPTVQEGPIDVRPAYDLNIAGALSRSWRLPSWDCQMRFVFPLFIWLVVGTFFIFHILAIGIPTDFRFFRGVAQPPTSYDYRISRGFPLAIVSLGDLQWFTTFFP